MVDLTTSARLALELHRTKLRLHIYQCETKLALVWLPLLHHYHLTIATCTAEDAWSLAALIYQP